jgi:ABC-type Na+ efflux pump permease subunit
MLDNLVFAYLRRLRWSLKEIILYSTAFGGAIIGLAIVTGLLSPGLFTPATRYALSELARRVLGVGGEVTNEILGVVIASIYAPFLAALTSSFVSAIVISHVISSDKERGVFEVMLAGPVTKRKLTIALLLYVLLTAFSTQVVVMAVTFGASLLVLNLLGYSIKLGGYYIEMSLFLVPSATFLAALLSLLLALIASSLGKVRMGLGPGQSLLSTISILPALIPFLLLNLNPSLDPKTLAMSVALVSIAFMMAILALSPRIVKEELLIS